MAERMLFQLTVAFLLGITGAYYRNVVVYTVGILYAIWLAVILSLQQKRFLRECSTCRRQFWKKFRIFLRLAACLLLWTVGFVRESSQQEIIRDTREYLAANPDVCVIGTIYKKEEKNGQVHYYLKNSNIIYGTDCMECNRVLVYQKSDTEYSIGDTIKIKGTGGRFRQARNEGNFDEESYYCGKNVLFRVKGERVELIAKEKFAFSEWLYQFRRKVQQVYLQLLGEEKAGVLGVMTLGEREFLDDEIKKLYQQSGISHILAISGLHISMIGMGIYNFLRKRKMTCLTAGVAAGLLVVCFGRLSGMEISGQRAIIMFLMLMLGTILGMAYDSLTALSLAAFLQLWENPESFLNAGFLFSYSAVCAVVVVSVIWKKFWNSGKERGCEKKKKRKNIWHRYMLILRNTILLNGCIQLVTLPLSVYFYYEFPVYGILVNGMLLPFAGVILLSGLLGGMAGVFSKIAGKIILLPAYVLLEWNTQVCRMVQKLPKSTWITGQPKLVLLVVYYLLLAAVLYLMYWMTNKDYAGEEKYLVHRRKGEKVYEKRDFCYGKKLVLSLLPVIAMGLLLTIRMPKEFQLCFLDVGQGDGIYIQTGEGSVFFVDGGSSSESRVGEYRILSFLKHRGISHVDGWFVSHGDQDHISGLLELWESGYRIHTLFLAEGMVKDEAWEKLCAMAQTYDTNIRYLKVGDCVTSGDLKLTCLFPRGEGSDRNSASMVLRLEHPKLDGILTGDISAREEQELERYYPDLHVDLYKAAHHGSNASNSEDFLQQIRPIISVVSCSKDNSYGHPGKEAVKRIEACGSRIFYTMEEGQITISCKEGQIHVKTFFSKKLRE